MSICKFGLACRHSRNSVSKFKIKSNGALCNKIPDFNFSFDLFYSMDKTCFEQASFSFAYDSNFQAEGYGFCWDG